MHKSIERFREHLRMTWHYHDKINWADTAPSPEKAFVLAVFSKIAYLKVPRYELQHHSLAKIIPCLTYQQMIAKGLEIDLAEFLLRADLSETFTLISEGIIAVGVIRQDVIIISLRGTRPLYLTDWMTDLSFGRIRVNTSRGSFHLHGGFFESVVEFVERLSLEVQGKIRNLKSPPPVYLTGHSLGGALAAIIGALDAKVFFSRLRGGCDITYTLPVHSTYTFGMPRYCDLPQPTSNPSPVHTFQPNDIVPSLPPAWLSYADSPHEYVATHSRWNRIGRRSPSGFDAWTSRLWGFRGVRSHFIESYVKVLKTAV
jgi:hypothetical protein